MLKLIALLIIYIYKSEYAFYEELLHTLFVNVETPAPYIALCNFNLVQLVDGLAQFDFCCK
jgi:hypothetical protein